MPELPEVETVVRALRTALAGKSIVGIRRSRKRLRQQQAIDWKSLFHKPRPIEAVRRRGKWIILDLDDADCLLVHLGMTGRFFVVPREAAREQHTHVVFALSPSEEELRFRDVRRFGSVRHFTATALEEHFRSCQLGPEPFDIRPRPFFDRFRDSARCIKAILLDQTVIAGVGNIYADETLFIARLHPGRLGTSLDQADARRLQQAVVKVLRYAIEKKGSTIRDYFYENGQGGEYQQEFRVYGRTGEPCRRCSTMIERVRLAGRSTHFCPRCQS
jgi:formamidopyrimidine-DNA glycosylase